MIDSFVGFYYSADVDNQRSDATPFDLRNLDVNADSVPAASTPAESATDDRWSFLFPAELSFAGTAKFGSANDGVDFNEIAGIQNSIYLGTYNHVSELTGVHTSNLESSYTQLPTAYEGVARPIIWTVLDEEGDDGALTMVTKYVIDSRPLHGNNNVGSSDYSKSDLRAWLNSAFINAAFLSSEANLLVSTDVVSRMMDNTVEEANRGAHKMREVVSTGDRVFISGDNMCGATSPYAFTQPRLWKNAIPKKITVQYGVPFMIQTQEFTLRNGVSMAAGNNLRAILSYGRNASSNNHTSMGKYSTSSFGIQPAIKINPALILFASEISETGKPGTMPVNSLNYPYPASLTITDYDRDPPKSYHEQPKSYKLTILNSAITLTDLYRNGGALQNSGATPLAPGGTMTLTGTASEHTVLAYKIVREENGNRTIVGYGIGAANELNVAAKDLNGNNL